MDNKKNLIDLLDTLDGLCGTLNQIAASKSAIIKSMVEQGGRESKAIEDFYQTVGRFTSQIDETVKEIRKILGRP